jgi:hypothetical protein
MDRQDSSEEKPTLRKWRFGLNQKDSLEEVIDRIPPQSKKFFKLTDKELAKVELFWEDRMEQAKTRFEELSQQWKELTGAQSFPTFDACATSDSCFDNLPTDHRKEYQASQSVELHAPKALKSVLPKHAHFIPGSNLVRRTFARAKSPEPSSKSGSDENDHSDDPKKSADMARDESIAKQKAALRHGRPEEYTQARSKLKLASEFIVCVL